MLTLEGTYKDGAIILSERPTDLPESRVLITFIQARQVDLSASGVDRNQALDLRHRLSPIADDWNMAEMDIYDVD